MDILKAKKDSKDDIIKNIEDLYIYLEFIKHPLNKELNLLYEKDKELIIDSIGNISILYYIYAYSNNKVLQDKIAIEVKKSMGSNILIKSLFLIYTDLIDLKDINKSINPEILKIKNKEIFNIINN